MNKDHLNDKQHIDLAMQEYYIDSQAQVVKLKNGNYIGTASHIYDSVNGNEEQVYVLTNNGGGADEGAVPFTASDSDRANVQDVTVLMQGSQTKLDTKKLQHDTMTDWLETDLPTAVEVLGIDGSIEYIKPFVKDNVSHITKNVTDNVINGFKGVYKEGVGGLLGLIDQKMGEDFKKGFELEWVTKGYDQLQEHATNVVGSLGGGISFDFLKDPLAAGALVFHKNSSFPPPQFKDAATHLKEVIKQYPNAKIDLYAHSLGSMDVQYALACLTKEELAHIGNVHIYNGPNIYPALSDEQKARLDSIKHKIMNHIDHKDLVSLGYPDVGSDGASGIVKHILTKDLKNIGLQHMMHGYQYDQKGNLKLENGSERITRQEILKYNLTAYHHMKEQLKSSGGGLSAQEKRYLDSLQAKLLSQNLVEIGEHATEEIQLLRKNAVEDAEKLGKVLQIVPEGFLLSPDEVAAAYAAGGATTETIVTSNCHHFEQRLKNAQNLHSDLLEFSIQIDAGIEQLVATDQRLAGEFQGWNQIAKRYSKS